MDRFGNSPLWTAAALAFVFICSLSTSLRAGESPFRLLTSGSGGISFEFELPDWALQPLEVGGSNFSTIRAAGAEYLSREGYPDLPVYTAVLAVPPGVTVNGSFGIVSTASVEAAPPVPQIVPQRDGDWGAFGARPAKLSPDYLQGGLYPERAVQFSSPTEFRDYRVVRVTVCPFSYNPATGNYGIRRRISVNVAFQGATGVLSGISDRIPVQNNALYAGLFLNAGNAASWRIPRSVMSGAGSSPFDISPGWAAVRIDSSDLYSLSGASLAAAGIDLSGLPPSSLRMYAGPGQMLNEDPAAPDPGLREIAIKVTGTADGSFDRGDRILFYGEGLDRFTVNETGAVGSLRHRYDNQAVYWLAWGDPAVTGLRMSEYSTLPSAGVQTFTSAERWYHFEENTQYFADLQPDEPKSNPVPDFWAWWEDADDGGLIERRFLLPAGASGTGKLRCQFYGYEFWNSALWSLRLNGALINSGLNFSIATHTTPWIELSAGRLQEGENLLSLQGDKQALGYFELRLDTPLSLGASHRIVFHQLVDPGQAFQISESSPRETEIYDISDPAHPIHIAGIEQTATAVRFQVPGGVSPMRSFLALTDSSYAAPSSIRPVSPPSLRAQNGAEYLVIAPAELEERANALAALHATEYSTLVVRLEDIYNEFSLGPADPAAIRDFLQAAWQGWTVRPRFVALFGDGHNDYRGYTVQGRSRPNLVPPYLSTQDIAVDEWYVRFEQDGLPQIALGRIPVHGTADASVVIDKISRYTQGSDAGDWVRRAVLVADDGYDLGGVCDLVTNHVPGSEAIDSLLPMEMEREKIYLDRYPFDPPEIGDRKPAAAHDLVEQWNRGALLVNYLGHGGSTVWAQEHVFEVERDLPLLNNGYRLPLVLNSSCSIGHFDDYRADAMAEELILKSGGGAIGVYAGTRVTYASQNLALNLKLVSNLFRDERLTTGEAALLARTGLGAMDRGNAERYVLFGDPAGILHRAARKLTFSLESAGEMKAGGRVAYNGTVTDEAGSLDASFSGVAQVQFVSGSKMVSLPYQCNWSGTTIQREIVFNKPGATLFDGGVTVSGGRFSGAFVVPVNLVSSLPADSLASGNGNFSGYATSENADAAGAGEVLAISLKAEELQDSAGPKITLEWHGRVLADGDRVGADEPLELILEDENGINTTGQAGYQVALEVDDGTAYSADLTGSFRYGTDSYQQGTVSVDLSQVSGGLHSFRFRAADNALNTSRVEIMLNLSGSLGALSLKDVLNYPNPFREETDICFELGAPADVLVRIFSVAGRPVKELRKSGAASGFNRVRWDGTDEYQQKVANGVYIYKIICRPTSDIFDGTQEVEATGKALLSR